MSGSTIAGPSRHSSPAPSTYATSSFTPLPRSLLSGTGIRFSPSPTPGAGPSTPNRNSSAEPGEIRETVVGGDIFVDEIPQQTPHLPGIVSSDQFQPPGLFTTNLIPSVKKTENGVKVQLQKPTGSNKGKEKEQNEMDSTLLLPSHVLVDSVSPSKGGEAKNHQYSERDHEDMMEGVHFVDDDISKGSKRYFDPEVDETKEVEATFLATADQSKICQNCKRPGHRSKDCKHVICTTCGAEDSHERRDCPVGLVCFGCGSRGHRKQDCPDPVSRMSRRTGCDRCGSRDHMENTCHTIWRVYAYLSNDVRAEIIKDKYASDGWEKEAIGGRASEEWCYNCAREGHLGDDCTKRRGSLAKLTVPSAFSHEMASRGPFFTSSSRRNADLPPPTHSRFDDDQDDYDSLPFISGGYNKFGGSNAGKKSREKVKARQINMARNEGSDEEPSWFDNSRGGQSRDRDRDRGLNIRERGGRGGGGYSTPENRNGIGRRPWDSEYREPNRERDRDQERDRFRHNDQSNSTPGYSYRHPRSSHKDRSRSPPSRPKKNRNDSMPFSHGHLMENSIPSSAPPKVSFGKLSKPGSGSKSNQDEIGKNTKSSINKVLVGDQQNQFTPIGQNKNKNRNGNGNGNGNGTPIVEIPISNKKSSSKRKRKAKNNEDKERDWENEWRKNGNGGGKVQNWGKQFDEEMKNLNGGLRIKGKSGELNSALGGKQLKSIQKSNGGDKKEEEGGGGGGGGGRNKKDKPKKQRAKSERSSKLPVEGKDKSANTGQRYHGGYD
ncbi:uncharacterized protein I206_104185 [Kwoniella pini CBS 10737]|uniref:CCHC-type domain-containing protein n=1 Tax=Kwoniella pini CBS 10737 TaxID=1296096 RepID=A0A1B9I2E6_9TREE|nr:uncharacterized protein I206_04240 [Kwoniella pini CBS 10737]OCF49716.1 hypothetical protein I206_04240 [Kwoniella pini CBS 10737]